MGSSIELTHADLNSELVRKNYNRDILMMWVLLFVMCNMFTMFAHSQEVLALLIVNSVSIHYSTQIKNSFKSEKLYSIRPMSNFQTLMNNKINQRKFLYILGLGFLAMALSSVIIHFSLNIHCSLLYILVTSTLISFIHTYEFLASAQYVYNPHRKQRGASNLDEAIIDIVMVTPIGLIKYANEVLIFLPFVSLFATFFLYLEMNLVGQELSSYFFINTGILMCFTILHKSTSDVTYSLSKVYFKRNYYFKSERFVANISLLSDVYDYSSQMQYELLDFLIQSAQKNRDSMFMRKVISFLENNRYFHQQIYDPISDFSNLLCQVKFEIQSASQPAPVKESGRLRILRINRLISAISELKQTVQLHLYFLREIESRKNETVLSIEKNLRDLLFSDLYSPFLYRFYSSLPTHLRELLDAIEDELN